MLPLGGVVTAGEEVPPIVTNGLAMHLDAGDAGSWSGSGAWQDLTANSFDFTRSGPTFHGTVGAETAAEYFSFNGSSDRFVLASAHAGSLLRRYGRRDSTYTFDCWIYFTGSGDQVFTHVYAAGSKSAEFYIQGSSTIRHLIYDNAPGGVQAAAGGVVANRWIHLLVAAAPAAVPDGFFMINGQVTGSFDVTSNWTSGDSTNVPHIGGAAGSGGHFAGRMAILRFYDRVLGIDEAHWNFRAQRQRFGV